MSNALYGPPDRLKYHSFSLKYNDACTEWFLWKGQVVGLPGVDAETDCLMVTCEKPPLQTSVDLTDVSVTVPEIGCSVTFAVDNSLAPIMAEVDAVTWQVLQAAMDGKFIAKRHELHNTVGSPLKSTLSPLKKKPRLQHHEEEKDSSSKCSLSFGVTETDKNQGKQAALIKKFLPTLVVWNFPPHKTNTDLESFLNITAIAYGYMTPGSSAVLKVGGIDFDNLTYEVEFINALVARNMSLIQDLTYDNEFVLELQQRLHVESVAKVEEEGEANVKLSPCVSVENLPVLFSKIHFVSCINEIARIHNISESEDVVKLVTYNEDSNSCSIEFISAEAAKGVVSLPCVAYEGKKLILKQMLASQPEMSPITCIKVGNLPRYFDEHHFTQWLAEAAYVCCDNLLESNVGVIKSITREVDQNTCIVEFTDATMAKDFAIFPGPVMYSCRQLTIDLLKNEIGNGGTAPAVAAVVDDVMSKDPPVCAARIRIGNVANPLHKESFSTFLKNIMVGAGLATKVDDITMNMENYNDDNQSIDILFDTAAFAEKVINKLSGTQYYFRTLTFQSVINLEDDDADIAEINDTAVSSTSNAKPALPPGVRPRTDWTKYTTLKLLDLAISNSANLNSLNTHKQSKAWSVVWAGLIDAELYYSLKNIKSTLKSLKSALDTEGPQWPYRQYVEEFLGKTGKGSSDIKTALQLCKESPHSNVSRPSGNDRVEQYGIIMLDNTAISDVDSDKFNKTSTLLLISEYKERKYLFDDSQHRSTAIYKKIVEVMHSHGYAHLTVKDLSSRMGWLAKQFKTRYDAVLNKTGSSSEALNWEYYDGMALLLEGSAVLHPQKLRAFGTQFVNEVRSENDNVEKTLPSDQKAKKPSVSKFMKSSPPLSFKERKLQVSQDFVNQFTLMTTAVAGLVKAEDKQE